MKQFAVVFTVEVDADDPAEAYEEATGRVASGHLEANVWTVPADIDDDPVLYRVVAGTVQDGIDQ
jgi:hypothetical protein